MGKKSLAAYKYTRDVDEAAKFLERFRHQEGIQIEIIIKGDIGDFFSLPQATIKECSGMREGTGTRQPVPSMQDKSWFLRRVPARS